MGSYAAAVGNHPQSCAGRIDPGKEVPGSSLVMLQSHTHTHTPFRMTKGVAGQDGTRRPKVADLSQLWTGDATAWHHLGPWGTHVGRLGGMQEASTQTPTGSGLLRLPGTAPFGPKSKPRRNGRFARGDGG